MEKNATIAIVGTFDSKGEEYLFLKERIEIRGFHTRTVNVGTKAPSPFPVDHDLYKEVVQGNSKIANSRVKAVHAVLDAGQKLIGDLYRTGEINAMISVGGGTGTHLGTSIMHVLPVGVPKIMISTVASRDMSNIVGTKDITMMHSVADILGINTILGRILDQAAGAICGMAEGGWKPQKELKRIGLTMFGFITEGAEYVKANLEKMGYEVTAFHANGTGGMAMEELAKEGHFDAILDFATHEFADELKGGYCRGIGPGRLEPIPGKAIPRLVIPGGLDCAVLEFTRDNIPEQYKDRQIFYYDFRSAVRLDHKETSFIAGQLAEKLNINPSNIKILIPMEGWSEADRTGGPLYDPQTRDIFIQRLKKDLVSDIEIKEVTLHINDAEFAKLAADMMDKMLKSKNR